MKGLFLLGGIGALVSIITFPATAMSLGSPMEKDAFKSNHEFYACFLFLWGVTLYPVIYFIALLMHRFVRVEFGLWLAVIPLIWIVMLGVFYLVWQKIGNGSN